MGEDIKKNVVVNEVYRLQCDEMLEEGGQEIKY